MIRSTWSARARAGLGEVAERAGPRPGGSALGGGEELVDVAAGDVGELLAQLVRRDPAPRADRAQQRAGEGPGPDAGLDDVRAREDVGQRDDLRGVLGVDDRRAAGHRDHELVEQRPEDEVLPAGRRGDVKPSSRPISRRGRGGPCWRRTACRRRARSCACGPCSSTRRTHSPSRSGPRWTPDQASAGTSGEGSDMAANPSGPRPPSSARQSGDRSRGTPGRRRRSTARRRSGRRARRGGTPSRGAPADGEDQLLAGDGRRAAVRPSSTVAGTVETATHGRRSSGMAISAASLTMPTGRAVAASR